MNSENMFVLNFRKGFFNQRYANGDLKMSLNVSIHMRVIPSKLRILSSKNSPII